LLRDRALPFFTIERADVAQQLRGQLRRRDADLGFGEVLPRPEQRQQRADHDAERDRNDEPPFAAAHDRQIVEGVKSAFVHQRILRGWEMTPWVPARCRLIPPPVTCESWRVKA